MKRLLFALLVLLTAKTFSQPVTVLPQNGSYSQIIAPQGAFRFQRQFYLITQPEMLKAGFVNGMNINSIGFTIGDPQSDTTKGSFKVYLQNTANTVSRTDTNWTVVSSSTNSYHLTGLTTGKYEWQVISLCSGASVDTAATSFTNSNLPDCGIPTNLSVDNITSSTATLHWVSPASSTVTEYVVQYSRLDSVNWISDTVVSPSKSLTGLLSAKNYQWRVKTKCSGGYSDFASASFLTDAVAAGCNLPSALTVGTLTDTSASVLWKTAAGASFYSVRYRRSGTSAWTNVISIDSTYLIKGLKAGTTYQWNVRTVCGSGNGAYVAGSSFTTTGTTACYAPVSLSTDSITDTSALLSWPSTGAGTYTVRYRLKEFIIWTNAITPMTLVHNDSITIPKNAGPYDISLSAGPFSYTGGGVYVAFEYSDSLGNLPSANTGLCTTANTVLKGSNGQDSLRFILSLNANSADSLPQILKSTNLRPETRFGSPTMNDSVEVSNVYALGNVALAYGTPAIVSALIKNHTLSSQTYTVTLAIKDQASNSVRHTESQSVTIPADSLQHVTFAGWSPTLLEKDSILVSVPAQPGETNLINNSSYYIQQVTNNIMSYEDGTSSISNAGFDTLGGIILTRYSMNGCGKVNAAQIYLSNAAKNRSFRAVILDSTGTVVDTSNYFTPDSSQVNNFHSFYFLLPPAFTDADYYVGLEQTADSFNGYFPVGVQWEGTDIRSGAYYYRADTAGAVLTDQPAPGRLMIRAEVIPSSPTVAITGKLSLCPSSTDTLKTVSIATRFANRVINFSTQNSNLQFSAEQTLGTPNVYPSNTLSTNDWVSSTPDGQREFLELGFADTVPVNFVDIYENFNPGAVDTVYVKNPTSGLFEAVYTGTAAAATPAGARINHITFPLTSYNVSQVRIAINSPAVSGYNAIDAVSIGWIDNPAYLPHVGYSWSTGETTQTIYVTSAGSYAVAATDSSGCGASALVNVFTPSIVTPTISADRATTFCTGDTAVKLTSSQLSGNTWSNGATTRIITVSSTGTYTVSYNDGSGCGILTSAPTVVTVNPLPVVTVTGSLTFCPGASTTLNAGAGYSAYSWSTGATTSTISVSTASTFVATVTNGNGCKGKSTVVTSLNPLPSPTITGTTLFCPGGSTTLNAGSGFSSYSWSNGATTQTTSVSTAATFSVTVTNSFGCSRTTSTTTHLDTPPTPFIAGNPSFCPGNSTVLTANTGYSGYSWSTGATTQTITVNTVDAFTVTVTNGSGCTGSTSVTTQNLATPTPVISGSPFCPGSSTILSVNSGYLNYSWSTGATASTISVSTGTTFTVTVTGGNGCTGSSTFTPTIFTPPSPVISGNLQFCSSGSTLLDAGVGYHIYSWSTGEITHAITVSSVGSYSVDVTDNNGCTGSASTTTSYSDAVPNAPATINGQAYGLCNASAITFSISPVSLATYYLWTVPAEDSILSGQGTTSITVLFTGFTVGYISVVASNTCGQSPATVLEVNGTATVTGIIAGPTTVCKVNGIAYSIPLMFGATSYTWSVPAGAVITSGQGSNAIVVNFGKTFLTTGTVCVIANNACGGGEASCINLQASPSMPVAIFGLTAVCKRQANVLYSIAPVQGAASYTWSVPSGAKINSGQGTTAISVTYGAKSGDVTVRSNSACSNSSYKSLAVVFNCREAENTFEDGVSLNAYPNPTSGHLTVSFNAPASEHYTIKVMDVIGHVLMNEQYAATEGDNLHEMDLSNIAKGMYFLGIEKQGETAKIIRVVVE